MQQITIFSAGISASAKEAEAGKALIAFLMAPASLPVIIKTGFDPIPPEPKK